MPNDAEGSVLTGTPEADAGGWTDGFEDNVREHMATKGYSDPGQLANAYMMVMSWRRLRASSSTTRAYPIGFERRRTRRRCRRRWLRVCTIALSSG